MNRQYSNCSNCRNKQNKVGVVKPNPVHEGCDSIIEKYRPYDTEDEIPYCAYCAHYNDFDPYWEPNTSDEDKETEEDEGENELFPKCHICKKYFKSENICGKLPYVKGKICCKCLDGFILENENDLFLKKIESKAAISSDEEDLKILYDSNGKKRKQGTFEKYPFKKKQNFIRNLKRKYILAERKKSKK